MIIVDYCKIALLMARIAETILLLITKILKLFGYFLQIKQFYLSFYIKYHFLT